MYTFDICLAFGVTCGIVGRIMLGRTPSCLEAMGCTGALLLMIPVWVVRKLMGLSEPATATATEHTERTGTPKTGRKSRRQSTR
jgi:hypothetical protein